MNKKLIIAAGLLLVLGAILAGLFFKSTSVRQAVTPDQNQLAHQLLAAKTAPVVKKKWPPEGTAKSDFQKPTFVSPSGRYRITVDENDTRTFYDLRLKTSTLIKDKGSPTAPDPWGVGGYYIYQASWSPKETRFVLKVSTGSDNGFSVFEINNGAPVFTGISWDNLSRPYYVADYMGHWHVNKIKWLDDNNAVMSCDANATRNWGEELCCMTGGPINAEINMEYQYTVGKGLRIRSREVIIETNQFKHSKVDDIFNYKLASEIDTEKTKYFRGLMSAATITKLRQRVTDKQDRALLEELIRLNQACYR